MGMSILGSCHTDVSKPLPVPNPSAYQIISKVEFVSAHVLRVKYTGCTNFEGEKIMVYKGPYIQQSIRDPHFSHSKHSPIARFRPDKEGWKLALDIANHIRE